MKIKYNKIARKIPNKIKNGWYNESKIIPKNICKNAEEKSISSFDVPFCIEIVSKKRFANSDVCELWISLNFTSLKLHYEKAIYFIDYTLN